MSRTAPSELKICFRCQLRLSRRALYLRPKTTSVIQSRRFATSSSLAHATTGGPPDRAADSHKDEWKPFKKVKQARKLRAINGHLARPSVANLGTEALGEPAKVILLRDAMLSDPVSYADGIRVSGAAQDLKSAGEKTPGTENLTLTELLAEVEEERGFIRQESVNKNIEALLPHPATVLSQESFSKLADELCRGFTAAQLASYIHTHEAKKSPSPSPPENKAPANLEQTEWTPVAAPIAKPQQEADAAVRSMTQKRRYAEGILKRCWRIQTEEEYESVGQLDLFVGHRELSLLLREKSSLMQGFSETYNCQVNVSRSRRIVRIMGRKYDAQNLALALRKTVKSIACGEFDMVPFLPLQEGSSIMEMIETPTIEAISRATDTEIEPDEGRNKFNIYYWGWKTVNLEKARRLLLARLKLPNRANSAVFADTESAEGLLALFRTEPGTELPLEERNVQWSRWRFGSPKGDGNPPSGGDLANDNTRPTKANKNPTTASGEPVATRLWTFLQTVESENTVNNRHYYGEHIKDGVEGSGECNSNPTQASAREAGTQNSYNCGREENQRLSTKWSTHPRLSIDVKLGQVLHNTDGLSPVQVKKSLAKDTDHRSFSTGLPGLPNLLRIMKPLETASRQCLAMRLVPSPWMPSGLEGITMFPRVEIFVQINEDTNEPQLPVVQAVVEENIADLMLPNRLADLRFTKRTSVTLLKPLLDEKIRDFVSSGELRADGIQPPGVPAGIELQIPKRLILGDCTSDLELIKDSEEECALVQYILSGLDVRQSVRFDYGGWEVAYSDVNSGKVRGRRVELLMEMARSTPETGDSNSESSSLSGFPAFYADARRLVDEFEARAAQGTA
ncbi:hypothetical protein GP486_005442 [Trichoglossum hirsutum]|uniref:K Homology domain-containing protein n=1 Tax=Trichoglossum hirsutum TaxID=265104 RepID=A0A9P8L973_9PEZI|nr:hypothetical protein GP486_005442 [Trichoglossum hirsutum]